MANARSSVADWWRGWAGPRGVAALAALLSGALFLAAWTQAGRWRDASELQRVRDDVRVALSVRSNALVSALERRIALFDGLHAYVELRLRSPDFADRFTTFASRVRTTVPGVRDIALARGKAYEIVIPPAGRARTPGDDPLHDPRPDVRADTRRALDGDALVLSGPADFARGDLVLVVRRAVHVEGRTWGLLAAVLDFQPILDEAGLSSSRGGLLIAVRRGREGRLVGPAEAFQGNPVRQAIDLPDGPWEMAGRPEDGWGAALRPSRHLWLVSGIVLSLVPMTLVFVLAWRQRVRSQYQARTEALVEERTAALARTSVIVANSPVILVRWLPGENWPVDYVSDNIAQFGYSADDFLSGRLSWADILLPEDLDRIRAEAARDRQAGVRRTRQEYRILTADGAVRWMEDRTAFVEGSGGQPIHQGILIDITERKQREQAQEEAERRLRGIFERVQLAAVMTDADGRVTFCNSFLLGLTGWGREEVLGADWFDTFVPEPERGEVRRWFRSALASGAPGGSHEYPIVTRGGARRVMSWDHTRIRGAAGEAAGMASFGRDLTDQRQLEAQYLQSQKMEAVGQLAGGIAHDFNNLLQVISGFAGLALDDLPEGAPARREILEVERAAGRATSLVRQLLAFSRRQPTERRVVDLNEAVASLMTMLRRVIGEHIDLHFAPGADVPFVEADLAQIEQVLVNLSVNARDAMPGGGRLTIATALAALGPEFVERHPWARPGRFVVLTVSDTGPGIPPAVLAHIFEPFFTTKDVGKGSGLGLATVYGIVKQHDGMIDVATGPESGTAFMVYLPAETGTAAPAEPARAQAAGGPGGETILVAEDDALVRALAVRVLEQAGFEVLAARDGAEAIGLVESRGAEIDLALVDLVMPKVSGPQVRRRIRELHPSMAVVYCSGYSRSTAGGGADEAAEEGTCLLMKPYTRAALLDCVRAALAPRGPARVQSAEETLFGRERRR